MILKVYRCDRCEEEEGPFEFKWESTYITLRDGDGEVWHYCSWDCALRACGGNLDYVEKREQANEAE